MDWKQLIFTISLQKPHRLCTRAAEKVTLSNGSPCSSTTISNEFDILPMGVTKKPGPSTTTTTSTTSTTTKPASSTTTAQPFIGEKRYNFYKL